jgi:hypothetical protein
MSPLCQAITIDGRTVQVEIYGGDPGKWILEVVDEFNNSTVWDDQYETDKEALEEVEKAIKEEGIQTLIGKPSDFGSV